MVRDDGHAYRVRMPDVRERRRVDALVARCYAGLDVPSLRAEALCRLRAVVSVDAAFFATVDPVTMLFTSAVAEEPLAEVTPLFLDNEFGDADVNRFAELAGSRDPVGSLDTATHGSRPASRRYTEILEPLDLGDELRVALRAGGHTWGVMCLHRGKASAGFSARDAAIVRRVAPHLAEGLRRAQLVEVAQDATPEGTGIVVLDADRQLVSVNAAAEQWLADIDDRTGAGVLPLAVTAAAARLESGTHPELAVCLRTRSARWVRIHASWLDGTNGRQIAVVLEPAAPRQLASVVLAVHGLTPAQERVAGLVLQGRTTRQIATALSISGYTVQEHLSAVFDKVGVRSRRELVNALLTGHG